MSSDSLSIGQSSQHPCAVVAAPVFTQRTKYNCGSPSLKYVHFDTANPKAETRGLVERIGLDGTRLVHQGPKGEVKRDLPRAGFDEAFALRRTESGSRKRLVSETLAWLYPMCLFATRDPADLDHYGRDWTRVLQVE